MLTEFLGKIDLKYCDGYCKDCGPTYKWNTLPREEIKFSKVEFEPQLDTEVFGGTFAYCYQMDFYNTRI